MDRQQKLEIELSPKPARRKVEENPRGNKRAIVILFLITFGLSLLFYLKGIIPKIFRDLAAPDKIIIEKKRDGF